MPDWLVEPFAKDHERSHFSCGQPTLDDFIRTRVSQYEKRRLGKTFVAVPPGERRVLGYHTLAASAVAFQHLPAHTSRQLPKHKIPVVLLARTAVDRPAQGKGLGEVLLLDALQRALDLSIPMATIEGVLNRPRWTSCHGLTLREERPEETVGLVDGLDGLQPVVVAGPGHVARGPAFAEATAGKPGGR